MFAPKPQGLGVALKHREWRAQRMGEIGRARAGLGDRAFLRQQEQVDLGREGKHLVGELGPQLRPTTAAHVGQPAANGIERLEPDRDLQPAGAEQNGSQGAKEGKEIGQEVAGGGGQLRPVDGHDGADIATAHGLGETDDALHREQAGTAGTGDHVLVDRAIRDPVGRQRESRVPERA